MIAEPPIQTQIQLWDFQQEAIDAVKRDFASGENSVLISLPTGSGKTVTAVVLVQDLIQKYDRPVVFLVHLDELAKQAIRKFRQLAPDLTVGHVANTNNDLGKTVTVASVQTLAVPRRMNQLVRSLGKRPIVVVDEAHHYLSPLWASVVAALDPFQLIGLTATAYRSDKVALGGLFNKISYHKPLLELIARGILAMPKGIQVETKVNLDRIRVAQEGGDFSQGSLSKGVNTPERNALIVEAWKEYCQDKRSTTAVFCVDVEHALWVSQAFQARGIWSECIHGQSPQSEREWLEDTFAAGKLPVLTNCMLLTEGVDIPAIDAIIMARPTKSSLLYTQIIGRGLRTAPGKQDCLIIDVVDVTSKHSLMNMPTLAGIENPEVMAKMRERAARGEVTTFMDLVDEEAVANRQAREVNLLSSSRYLWRKIEDYWVAPGDQLSFVVLCPSPGDDLWIPLLVNAPLREPPSVRALFDRPLDVGLAMGVAESQAPASFVNQRDQPWRQRQQPTPKQIRAAETWRIDDIESYTSAQLSDLIREKIFLKTARVLKLKQRVEKTAWRTPTPA